MPPGPRGLPILGNVFHLTKEPWLTFTAWKDQYGPIMHVKAPGRPIIVINDGDVAEEILERNAAKTSGRGMSVLADIVTGGLMFGFRGIDARFHRGRKAIRGWTRKGPGLSYRLRPIIYGEAVMLANNLLKFPNDWLSQTKRSTIATSLAMVYDKPPGETYADEDATIARLLDYVSRIIGVAKPGGHLVDLIPWLIHVPSCLSPWKRRAEQTFVQDSVMVKEWLEATRALEWWFMAMILYPDSQKRAQDELERVVGSQRLPTFDDYDQLPYIQAMVREALRWRPVAPLGVPHVSTEDLYYGDYFIPKQSLIMANTWAINHDPKIWGQGAHRFDPARHLDSSGTQIKAVAAGNKGEPHASFGFGRRICPGRYLADDLMFIFISLILWAVNINRGTNADGDAAPIDADGSLDEGVTVRPIPFSCTTSPRDPEAKIVLQAAKEALGR
ncbi:hypothetical protein DL771_000684 [Monosporascus sp. 5C6A]|nr:hypothetical protein DL771_000684 [Monosporascus sp. 5C6A]